MKTKNTQMITREQYLDYKKLVEDYEQQEFEDGCRDSDEALNDDWDEEDEEEQRENDRAEIAGNCTCGAWVFGKEGRAIHVADCICGAE